LLQSCVAAYSPAEQGWNAEVLQIIPQALISTPLDVGTLKFLKDGNPMPQTTLVTQAAHAG